MNFNTKARQCSLGSTLKLVVLGLVLLTPLPCWAQKAPKVPVISALQYRAQLETVLRQLKVLEKHPPRPLGPILDKLDVSMKVRRADGQTQSTDGNAWSNLKRDLSKAQDAKREEVAQARDITQSQINSLDEWTQKPTYTPVDAQKIVSNLEKSGQIRVEPLWWQKSLSDGWKSVASVWDAFIKWFTNLFPKAPASKSVPVPSDKWLWGLLYVFVAAILLAVGWYVFRAFGGGWRWGGRTVRRDAALEGEDARLLLLPPSELRSRADEFAAQGNFREALRHRYLALLVQLDARGVWRYDARRTNWEHIAALRRQENKRVLVSPLSELTRRFDRVRYGGAPCDVELWQQFDADARQFESESSQFEVAGSAR